MHSLEQRGGKLATSLGLLQRGHEATDWKPMPRVGAGTIEVRIHAGTSHRVFVVSKFEEAIYVLHAFTKRSQQTAQRDMNLARERYRALTAERQRVRRGPEASP